MASSSSSSSLTRASSSQSWKYDVFISFRGEDTRKTFVDHLYEALVHQGINTFKDDEALHQGEMIGPSLMKAIEESQIAIIVFSKNYADSSWCLDELAHVMKCKDTRGQIVMPIFYDVDPSEVRKQKRTYGEAFAKHEWENKNKIEYWRKALVDASNLSGWEPKNIASGRESKVIKEIVDKISSRLQLVTLSADENLIGIATRIEALKSKLQIGSGGVHMIGVWGVGGGGKTTLASSIYDEISSKFDGCCFVENIREESSRYGLEKLQEKILSRMEANSFGGGRSLINKRFRHRKVLIVLDDIDHLDQLKALAGSPNWFGEGSRIIITTRNEHLLKAHKVMVHNISLLNVDEAIELFRKHAPKDDRPMEDYDQLSKEVVSYAGGLPLALTVLGSFLCDKNIHQWRSALARLKEIPDADILEKLKISFDGLTKVQKDLFLDIACFFRWEKKDMAMERLDACGFHPVIGVEELRQKALITILDGKFDMHDLVQEMGHYIVRGEYPKNPEKHTRVWKREDILTICAIDATMELDKIEAITIDYDTFLQDSPRIVANMRNLRYIDWKGDPANPLLDNFPPRELCCLVLSDAIHDQLWSGYKYLPNLKKIELRDLDNLIMTPNFNGLPNLERFFLYGSPNLKEIDASFGRMDKLVSLCIEECPRINKFPPITRLKILETLSFKGSPGLFELSEIQQKMENLPHDPDLDDSGDTQANKLRKDLIDGECFLPHDNVNHIQCFFFHRYLRKLDLRDCNLGDEDMSSAVWELPNLQELNLAFNNFSRLNFGLLQLPRLKFLDVSDCKDLIELSKLPSSIAVLEAENCPSLETLGDFSDCKWLWKVLLHGVYNVGPYDGYILLDSMLKGNAIENHRISVTLQHQIPKGVLGGLFRGKTLTMRLPPDWDNDLCGFLIHIVTYNKYTDINIIMKQEEPDEDPPFELWQEEDEALVPKNKHTVTYVGYVSFSSLRRSACWSSAYNVISFSLHTSVCVFGGGDRLGAALVHKTSKDDSVQTTRGTIDRSEFWDEEDGDGPKFRIQHDSKSSFKILWKPYLDI